MPIFNLICETCGEESKVLRKSEKELKHIKCLECHSKMTRQEGNGATSRIVECLDNGVMSKAVERPADAEELYRERSKDDQKRHIESLGLFSKI